MTEEQLQSLIAQFRQETEDLIDAVVYQWYFNDGQVWASTTEVLNLITSENRKAYRPINVAGTLYWFKPDLTTLEPIFGTLNLTVANGTVFYRKSAGDGPPEVQPLATLRADLNIPDAEDIVTELAKKVDKANGYSLVSNNLIAKIHDKFSNDEAAVIQDIIDELNGIVRTENNFSDTDKSKLDALYKPIEITLPAASTVQGRINGAVSGSDYPSGIVLTATGTDGNDLTITHGLGKRLKSVFVLGVIDGVERWFKENKGFAGFTSALDKNSCTIEILAQTEVPIIINLII